MKTLNLYKYADNNPIRPIMAGVCHRNGYKVVSNGLILAALKADYAPELEDKVIAKDGTEIIVTEQGLSHRFPNFRNLIPKDRPFGSVDAKIDFAKLNEIKKQANECKRLAIEAGIRGAYYYIKIGEATFRLDLFLKIADAMKAIGTDTICTDRTRAAYCITDTGFALIMPVCYPTEDTPTGNGGYYAKTFTLAA